MVKKTMKKIGMETILNTLCEELDLTPEFSRPFGFNVFENVMLSRDIFTTERVIETRWKQLLAMDGLIQSKTMSNSYKKTIISLDIYAVRAYINLHSTSPKSNVCVRERERDSASTEAVQ